MIVVRWTRATHLVGDDGERIRQPGWTAILLMPGDGGLAVDDPPVGAGLDRNDVKSRWTISSKGRWLPVAQSPHEAALGVVDPPRQHRWSSWQAAVDL